MQCILYKIYFWKVFHKYYNLICTPMWTKFYSCKKWVLQCIMTTEGHEVVGLGYSELSHVVGSGTVKEMRLGSLKQRPVNPGKASQAPGGKSMGSIDDSVVAGASKRPAPRWCPRGISKTQRRRLQKLRQKELAEKREEEECDRWFDHARPMTRVKQT
jgi:hypothetical protein